MGVFLVVARPHLIWSLRWVNRVGHKCDILFIQEYATLGGICNTGEDPLCIFRMFGAYSVHIRRVFGIFLLQMLPVPAYFPHIFHIVLYFFIFLFILGPWDPFWATVVHFWVILDNFWLLLATVGFFLANQLFFGAIWAILRLKVVLSCWKWPKWTTSDQNWS